jgi:[ribosomal protein S5]-alanine N-acetyltransferase
MQLHTERLRIFPLSPAQMRTYLQPGQALEEELGLTKAARDISPALAEAFETTFFPALADPAKNYLYCTLWTVVLKSENVMVGDLCFQGEPNEAGEVEIGYGTHEAFQNKGYMTEAVGAIIGWAAQQLEIKAIVADTDKTNPASFSVLIKNGFEKSGETQDLFKWRRELRTV